MNVKITEHSITYKITEVEMQQLLNRETLTTTVSIVGNRLLIIIVPSSQEQAQPLALKLSIEQYDTYLTLYVAQQAMQRLATIGRNREGVSTQSQGLTVTLQVDIRADSRFPNRLL